MFKTCSIYANCLLGGGGVTMFTNGSMTATLTDIFSIYTMLNNVVFFMHNIWWLFSMYTIYTNDFFSIHIMFTCGLFFFTFKYILFGDVMLLSLGPPVRGTPDVRYGWWKRDGWSANLHADGDGRRQRPVQLWHLCHHPRSSSFQSP